MPRKKSGKYIDNNDYQRQYHKNMKAKLISFNPSNSEDMVLWDYMMSKGYRSITPYIKRLIKEDMLKNEGGQKMTYKIKPEYYDEWFVNSPDPDYIVTEDELNRLSKEWCVPVKELLKQLEEQE